MKVRCPDLAVLGLIINVPGGDCSTVAAATVGLSDTESHAGAFGVLPARDVSFAASRAANAAGACVLVNNNTKN